MAIRTINNNKTVTVTVALTAMHTTILKQTIIILIITIAITVVGKITKILI
jgi:hypothetical protein